MADDLPLFLTALRDNSTPVKGKGRDSSAGSTGNLLSERRSVASTRYDSVDGAPYSVDADAAIRHVRAAAVIPQTHGPKSFRRYFCVGLSDCVVSLFWYVFVIVFQLKSLSKEEALKSGLATKLGDDAGDIFARYLQTSSMKAYQPFFLRYSPYALAEAVYTLYESTFADQSRTAALFGQPFREVVYRYVVDVINGFEVSTSLITKMMTQMFPEDSALHAGDDGRVRIKSAETSRGGHEATLPASRHHTSKPRGNLRQGQVRSQMNPKTGGSEDDEDDILNFDFAGTLQRAKQTENVAVSMMVLPEIFMRAASCPPSMKHRTMAEETSPLLPTSPLPGITPSSPNATGKLTTSTKSMENSRLSLDRSQLSLSAGGSTHVNAVNAGFDPYSLSPAMRKTGRALPGGITRVPHLRRTVDMDEEAGRTRIFSEASQSLSRETAQRKKEYDISREEAIEEINAIEDWYAQEMDREEGAVNTLLNEPDEHSREALVMKYIDHVMETSLSVHDLLRSAENDLTDNLRRWREAKAAAEEEEAADQRAQEEGDDTEDAKEKCASPNGPPLTHTMDERPKPRRRGGRPLTKEEQTQEFLSNEHNLVHIHAMSGRDVTLEQELEDRINEARRLMGDVIDQETARASGLTKSLTMAIHFGEETRPSLAPLEDGVKRENSESPG